MHRRYNVLIHVNRLPHILEIGLASSFICHSKDIITATAREISLAVAIVFFCIFPDKPTHLLTCVADMPLVGMHHEFPPLLFYDILPASIETVVSAMHMVDARWETRRIALSAR